MIDWKSAFDKQCHNKFFFVLHKNGVRKSLIPILIPYFQNRKMPVKWNNEVSSPYPLPGGGAQGGQLGQIEYLSQTNENVDFHDFNLQLEEMITIYTLFIRSSAEYCCVVWHSSITEEELFSKKTI